MADTNYTPIFGGGFYALELILSDESVDVVHIEREVYERIVDHTDQDVVRQIVSEYNKLYGDSSKYVVRIGPYKPHTNDDTEKLKIDPCGQVNKPPSMLQTSKTQLNTNKQQSPAHYSQVEEPAHSHDLFNSSQSSSTANLSSQGQTFWKHDAILLLLSKYNEFKELFNNSLFKQKEVWDKIAQCMCDQGFSFTGFQCNEKFRAMKYRHKKIVDNNSKSGRDRKTWQYYQVMEDLISGDPAVRPVAVMASAPCTASVNNTKENTNQSIESVQINPEPPAMKTMKKETEKENVQQNHQNGVMLHTRKIKNY